jgi:hypothetical protein
MELIKTSEKILVWMHRNGITGRQISLEIGITRQAWSQKIKSNIFSISDLMTIKRMGFKD